MVSKSVQHSIDVVSFDLGNRFNAITDGKKIVNFVSVLNDDVSPDQDFDFTLPDFKDKQSFKVTIDGDVFEVGKVAAQSFGIATFSGSKWESVKPFLFAAIAGICPKTDIQIKELRCAVPDDKSAKQRKPIEALAGKTWNFSVNDIEYSVKIDKVRIAAEGQFAWYGGITSKLYAYPTAQNAVLDLGGGTAIARLFNADGTINRRYELVLENGTCKLASDICAALGKKKLETQILDGIADGSFKTATGVVFKTQYDKLFPKWIRDIRAEMNTRWKSINDQYAQILVVGGSAPLVKEVVAENPRYIIAPNPQFYALQSMQTAA